MSDFWSKLLRKQRSRQETTQQKYRALVAAVCDGKAPGEAEVMQALDLAGKTVEQLQADVERLARRRQARAALDKAAAVPAEREQIDRQLKAAAAAFEAADKENRERYQATAGPLELRLRELARIERDGENARRVLEETAEAPADQAAEVAEIEAQLRQARQRWKAAEDGAHRELIEASDHTTQANIRTQSHVPPSTDVKERHLKMAADHREEEQRQRDLAAEAEREVKELEGRLARLQEAALTP